MAQVGLMFSDEGKSLTVLNDSGTTAITAGDLVYAIASANDDKLTGTFASVRGAYTAADVAVKSAHLANTAYRTILGIALEDIPADGYGAVAMEGLWMHPVQEDVNAGQSVQFYEGTAQKLQVNDAGTTAGNSETHTKIGKAITGGTADGKYILWKLTL